MTRSQMPSASEIPFATTNPQQVGNRRLFQLLAGGGYALTLLDDGVRVEVRHLRRERHQLHGEVDVLCEWAGVRTFNGSLSCADLNLSSQSARDARGKYCARQGEE